MIRLATLFSGSSGNSTLVSDGKTNILIDAGKNCKAVCTSLGNFSLTLSDISAIFITHEHNDHISALDVICHKCPMPIHITEPSARFGLKGTKWAYDCADIHDASGYSVRVGTLAVTAFPLPHDSVCHMGYLICDGEGDKACVCTDMGYVTNLCAENITGVRQAVIEANHDIEMLKSGPYPAYLKQRILSREGHLSNKVSSLLAVHLAKNGLEKLILAHLSAENNDPALALDTVRGALSAEGFENVAVKIAKRHEVTEI